MSQEIVGTVAEGEFVVIQVAFHRGRVRLGILIGRGRPAVGREPGFPLRFIAEPLTKVLIHRVEAVGIERVRDRLDSLRRLQSDLLLCGDDFRQVGIEGPVPVPVRGERGLSSHDYRAKETGNGDKLHTEYGT